MEQDAPGLRFAERWAEFTRAAAIYPDSSCRVREALASMWTALSDATACGEAPPGGGLAVRLRRDAVAAGGATGRVAPGTNLAWLGDRLRKAGLAGVRFFPGAADGPILDFTRRLLSLWSRNDRDPRFEDLWPEAYPGIELIDWRFRGTFGGPEAGETSGEPEAGVDAGSRDSASEEDLLVMALEGDPGVRTALGRLRAALSPEGRMKGRVRSLDVLGEIVRQLPRDAPRSPDKVAEMATAVIESLAERAGTGAGAFPPGPGTAATLMDMSRVLLGRSDRPPPPGPVLPNLGPGPGRLTVERRDKAPADDPHAFAAELADLPPPRGNGLSEGEVEDPAEQVGTILHFLADPAEDAPAPSPIRHLRRLLDDPGPAVLAVLAAYVAPVPGDRDEAAAGRRSRVILHLREAGLSRTVRRAGGVTVESALERFPAEFGLFAESVHPWEPEDLGQLASLVDRIPRDRVLGARAELSGREKVQDPVRAEPILALRSPGALPFIRVLIEAGDSAVRPGVVEALARIRGETLLVSVMRLFPDATAIPRSFLLALTDPDPGADGRTAFHHMVVTMLRRIIGEMAGRRELIGARADAIRCLGSVGGDEARSVLRGILHDRRLGLLPREPREIRDAARAALRAAPGARFEEQVPCASN